MSPRKKWKKSFHDLSHALVVRIPLEIRNMYLQAGIPEEDIPEQMRDDLLKCARLHLEEKEGQ